MLKDMSKKEKILLATSIVGIAAAGYFGFKYLDVRKTFSLANAKNSANEDKLNFIEFLVIESDCVPKALQNAENKLARKETKIKELCELLLTRPDDSNIKNALAKHEAEADMLRTQIGKTYKLQDLILNDENIYAK